MVGLSVGMAEGLTVLVEANLKTSNDSTHRFPGHKSRMISSTIASVPLLSRKLARPAPRNNYKTQSS